MVQQPAAETGAAITMAYTACPLCEAPVARARWLGDADCRGHSAWREGLPPTLTWLRCEACGHVFTRDYFTPAGQALLFGTAHDGQILSQDLVALEMARFRWEPAVQQAIRLLPWAFEEHTAPSWLDVGFGNGTLLLTAAELGFHATGIDTRASAVEAMRIQGIEAMVGDFLALRSDRSFDVVSFADVIEHMAFPHLALARAAEFVRPGGLAFVSFPNMDSPLWRAMDARNSNVYWPEIEHHHNFSRRSAFALLRAHGFQVCHFGLSQRYLAGMEIWARRL